MVNSKSSSRVCLLEKEFSREELCAIYDHVGQAELLRMASVIGADCQCDDNELVLKIGADSKILMQAVSTASGKDCQWIMGFSSDFAKGLLESIDG